MRKREIIIKQNMSLYNYTGRVGPMVARSTADREAPGSNLAQP